MLKKIFDHIGYSLTGNNDTTVRLYQYDRYVMQFTYFQKANYIFLEVFYDETNRITKETKREKFTFGTILSEYTDKIDKVPCVVEKYPKKDKYTFVEIQNTYGGMGNTLWGDYKEWSDKELNKIANGIVETFLKLARWRIESKSLQEELCSAWSEPDLNIVSYVNKQLTDLYNKIFKG